MQAGKGVYIEIQGHTDAIGGEAYNEHLGLERAEAVRRYLSQQHKFPLHRINVTSYGESAPSPTTRAAKAGAEPAGGAGGPQLGESGLKASLVSLSACIASWDVRNSRRSIRAECGRLLPDSPGFGRS